MVENFVQWCQHERHLSFGTIGTYLNSLISCVNFAHACRICDVEDELLQAMYNLRYHFVLMCCTCPLMSVYILNQVLYRLQAEAQCREDRKWRRPHPAWISWGKDLLSGPPVVDSHSFDDNTSSMYSHCVSIYTETVDYTYFTVTHGVDTSSVCNIKIHH